MSNLDQNVSNDKPTSPLLKISFSGQDLMFASIREEILDATTRVLDSGQYILGNEVKLFENDFSNYIGVPYTVGCASGMDAISLALKALGIGPGDEVITVSFTAVPTIAGIVAAGAIPIFCDIDDFFLMDVSKIEKLITKNTKAILPVHLYGQMVDMNAVMKIANNYNLYVIEDACQAHGAELNGQKSGSLGHIGCFSFYPTKNLGCYGDGGCLTTKDPQIYEKLLLLRNYGQKKRYYCDEIGINSRLDEIQASILRVKLKYLDLWNNLRILKATTYNEKLNSLVGCPTVRNDAKHVFHLYVVQIPNRDKILEEMGKIGISCLIHYPIPVHKQKAYLNNYPQLNNLEKSETLSNRILSLPFHPFINENEMDFVCNNLAKLLKK